MWHWSVSRGAYVIGLVLVLLVLGACRTEVVPARPSPLPTLAPPPDVQNMPTAPAPAEKPAAATSPKAPRASVSPSPTALAPSASSTVAGRAPTPAATVWQPRAIAIRVQQALAETLGVSVDDVPLSGYRADLDPARLTCLDQLPGDLPTFGEGEALVFVHRGVNLLVISTEAGLWVCREEEAMSQEMTLEQAQQAALEDLVRRLGVDAARVKVVSAEAVTWSDASLGCPQPGQMYAQVLTPGYRILLEVDGERYAYHGSKTRIDLCPATSQ